MIGFQQDFNTIEKTEDIATCDLRIINTHHRSFQSIEIKAKTLKELESNFNKLSPTVEALLFSKEQFTKQAQSKLKEILINYAKRSFSIMEIKISENLFDKETHETLNALIERNRQFRIRKLKLACLAPMIGTLLTAFFLGALFSTLLASMIIISYVYWDLNNDFKTTPIFITRKEMFDIRLALVFSFLGIHSLVWTGPMGVLISIFTGAGGLLLNHFRDQSIKEAITKYTIKDLKLNDEKFDSFTPQKSFMPTYDLNCSLNTYYAAPEKMAIENNKHQLKI